MDRPRVRIRFAKQGPLRWIGHRDLARLWERTCRRAGLRLAHSQGFHPKPKISFPLALAVGISAVDEVMEIELSEPCSLEELQAKLKAYAPVGLEVKQVELLPPGTPKAQVRAVCYQITIPADRQAEVAQWIARWEAGGGKMIGQGSSELPPVLRALEAIQLQGGQVEFTLRRLPEGLPNARELLSILGIADLEAQGAVLIRTRVELESVG
ncbi:MAG: TIGR03936 family radical SAM-associated protein [Thermoguttaceae bacterium]|nr:TIGR03936 family radical SAM-associated protein [Thermoguttaceae bacterium]MDW8038640.1 TIGR03936 family radical SAM-associated protein [Thermoguttaceae bacterium]